MKSHIAARFEISRQLMVRLGGGLESVDAQVKLIEQPLGLFWADTERPFQPPGEFQFSFLLSQMPLVSGTARMVAAEPRKGLWRLEIQVLALQKASQDDVSHRLAPFIAPELRMPYLAAGAPQTKGQDDPLGAWIESSSRLYLLVDLIARINSTRETSALIRIVMEAAREIMEAEASSLMLLDRETGELVISVPTGPAQTEISGIRIPAGKGLAGWVAASGQAALVEDASSDPRFYGDVTQSGFKTRDLVCVPLRNTEDEIIGVLQAVNKKGGSPFRERDLPIFTALAAQAAIALERDRLTREALQRKLLERELELASEIQRGFWPQTVPRHEGVEFAGMSLPAAQVGGDYYDFIQLDENRVGLVVADVAGKGVAASLLMATVRSALRAQVENNHPVRETVSLLNQTLVGDTPAERFITLFFGVLDCSRRELTYVNAGHNPPLLYDLEKKEFRLLEKGGPIIGFLASAQFEAGIEQLRSNQILALFSDGVTEAQNPSEDMFGEDRLMDSLRLLGDKNASEIVASLHREVKSFAAGAPQSDDITLMAVKIL